MFYNGKPTRYGVRKIVTSWSYWFPVMLINIKFYNGEAEIISYRKGVL